MTCPTRPDERLSSRVGHRITLSTPPSRWELLSLRPGAAHARRRPHRHPAARSCRSPARAGSGPPPARPLSGRGQTRTMSEQANQQAEPSNIVVVGPDGMAIEGGENDHGERPVIEMVEQPAKVMRIGSMIRQLLDEVKAAPLDEKSRARLAEIHRSSIKELEDGLAPELVEELERLSLPFAEGDTPSESELRIAQAQLVGWLEGLFHGIQTTLFAQQMAARAQLEQMRRALPPGVMPGPGPGGAEEAAPPGRSSGPYL